MSVSEILSRKGRAIITVPIDASIKDVVHELAEHNIGAIVVVSADMEVCGIVSERDIVRQLRDSGSAALENPLSSCMTSNVVSCDEDETIDDVLAKMTEGRFRHLPVIVDGELRGLISIGDVVKRKIEQAERDAADMKRYITG